MRNFYRVLSLAVFAVATVAAWAAVPFKTTSIVDGKFATNTTWYTMQIGTSQHIISDNAGASKISLTKVLADMSDADLWCFVGDDTNGYKIYNKQAGTSKVLASSKTMKALAGYGGTGGSTYPTMQDANNLPSGYVGTWDLQKSDKLAGVDGYFVILHGTNYAMNNFGGIGDLAFWAEGMDAGSTVTFGFAEGTVEINAANGTFTASNATKTWHAVWESNELAGFSLNTGQNNMTTDGGYIAAHSGTSNSCTHTLTAPDGMCIAGYSFDMKNRNGDNSYSENIIIGSKTYKSSTTSQHVEVTGLEDRTASFQQTGSNKGVIFSNYFVTLRRSTVEAEPQQDLFITKSGQTPFRIPAIATAANGDLFAISDYRPCGSDIGYGEVDIMCRISKDNGATWGNQFCVADGKGGNTNHMTTGYGDAAIVADCEENKLLVMMVCGRTVCHNGRWDVSKIGNASADAVNRVARVYFTYNEATGQWEKGEITEMTDHIYSLFLDGQTPTVTSMFIGSGKICQSRLIKKDKYYRLYCSMWTRDGGNRVIYSDDFGGSWNVLGTIHDRPAPGGDEPKIEELPDGSVLLSTRASGGRIFNVYTYSDQISATGNWAVSVSSGASNNGVVALSNSTNGEVMCLPVTRKSDNKDMYLLLQSVPFGSGRANVGIFYKELESVEDFVSPTNVAKDWDGSHQSSYMGSAYSTMSWQADDKLAFLYEEETHGGSYTIVYKNYTIEQITDDAYTYNANVNRYAFLAEGIEAKANSLKSENAYVGCVDPAAVESLNEAIKVFKANPTKEGYDALNKMIASLPTIELQAGHWYRLRNVERSSATLYLTPEASRFTAKVADKADADQVFQFVNAATAGQYHLYNGNFGLYLGKLGANETEPAVHSTTTDAGVWSIVPSTDGQSQVNCVNKTGSNPGLHLAGDNTRLVPWTSTAPASLWFIEPVTTYNVSVPESGYVTVNLPFAVKMAEGVKAYVATGVDQDNAALVLNEVDAQEGVVPAKTPVVLVAEAGEYALEVVYPTANSVKVAEGWNGTLKAANVSGAVYVLKNDKMQRNAGTSLAANVAYYLGQAGVSSYALTFGPGVDTGVNGVDVAKKSVKLYDLKGRRVVKPVKGVYVTEEGKKLLF